jgi:flagellin
MPQIINTNIASLNAQRNLNLSQNSLAVATQRLSSGLRVNSAKDDAAGMAIAERMYAQARGFSVAIRNANDGISLAQVAEGALAKITDNLQRMRELTVQARNATNSDGDKDSLDKEFGELAKEIQRITQGTTFNGKAILAQAAGSQIFQVGANTTANDVIDFTTTDLSIDAASSVWPAPTTPDRVARSSAAAPRSTTWRWSSTTSTSPSTSSTASAPRWAPSRTASRR